MLEDFAIYTDHKPLTHPLFRVSPLWSTRQQHHLSYLAEFTSSMVHLPGPENMVADTLFRPSTVSSPAPIPAVVSSPSTSALVSPLPSFSTVPGFDFSLLPPLQLSFPSIQEMKLSASLSMVANPIGGESFSCDSSTGSLCSLVPLQLRQQLYNLLLDVPRPGVRASRRLISSKFVWSGLSLDVCLLAKSCLQCVSRVKSQPTFIHLIQPFLFPLLSTPLEVESKLLRMLITSPEGC